MQICNVCKIELTSKNRNKAPNLLCKVHYNERYRADYAKNRLHRVEIIRKYAAKNGKTPHRREYMAEYFRREYKKHPEKGRAWAKLKYAVKRGIVDRFPCFCGNTKSQGHHADYSKPLDVVWLCAMHHSREHGRWKQLREKLAESKT